MDEAEEAGRMPEDVAERVEELVGLVCFVSELACDSAKRWEEEARRLKRLLERRKGNLYKREP